MAGDGDEGTPTNHPKRKTRRKLSKAPEKNVWKPGQSGNPKGRPKGVRNKFGEAFLEAIHNDFQEHGEAAIIKARTEKPVEYLKVCASLLPKDVNINVNPLEEMTNDQLLERIRALDAEISGIIGEGGTDGGTSAPGSDEPPTQLPSVH